MVMNVEEVREYCLSLPMVTEDMTFGEEHLLFRINGKIFACLALDGEEDYLAVKCDPDYALDLRDRYEDIEGAFHWNKKYWNQLRLRGNLGSSIICGLIRHSYSEVVKKMPKKFRDAHPDVATIRE